MSTKPMLMQLAEPEYMCTNCGNKFYGVKSIDKCEICKVEFDWSEPYKLGVKKNNKDNYMADLLKKYGRNNKKNDYD